MSLHLGWGEILLRLALATLAGLLVGFDRGEHGRPAGLRTTLLVCLAAAIAMLQANLLLGLAGKRPDSFIVMDLMRLPLGILSGMGFIGAGAILRRGQMIRGVTTAATLWYVTMMGLCFGGGQLGLGLAALALALIILTVLKEVERRLPHERQAALILGLGTGEAAAEETVSRLREAGLGVSACALARAAEGSELRLTVHWRAPAGDILPPPVVGQLAREPRFRSLRWNPLEADSS